MDWFQVDREGLRLLLGIRGIGRLIWELLQNCWDENVTKVTVTLETIPNKAAATPRSIFHPTGHSIAYYLWDWKTVASKLPTGQRLEPCTFVMRL